MLNESNEIEWKEFVLDFEDYVEYIGFCLDIEKGDELDEIDMMDVGEEEKEKMKSIVSDKFISDNIEKFILEFNIRFNKYNIYEVYIKL